ncbi:hypothetical protein DICVIV_10701 [Dictyocaulus viviparus]|uniref:Uncharacterized protein n=1 Tax=Dictyocaulus viviparus TaxID=29172 RepID=A0A0D8XHS9_DICVI|nr:hypothetical protein DICVIV_10701 [Dictyocaulus viviparus]
MNNPITAKLDAFLLRAVQTKIEKKTGFYGCVSLGLITTGLVFTVFSIFQKDSQIGKVWLAGPTTMVVGLVLCGKVIIDWGPAMLHAREGSVDSTFVEHYAHFRIPGIEDPLNERCYTGHGPTFHEPRCNGSVMIGPTVQQLPCNSEAAELLNKELSLSQYNSSSSNYDENHGMRTDTDLESRLTSSLHTTRHSSNATPASPICSICKCSKYGSIRHDTSPYQGETFVLKDRHYFI